MADGSSNPKTMSDDELSSAIADAERDSLAYMGSKLSKQRRDALKYYFAEPFDASTGLQPVPGRSSVVMQEVADTIDWIMPDLLKKFASGDRAVEFEANHEEGEQAAKQATAYVNYVFFHDNKGFMILHDLFQDALIEKNGIGKVWWDDQASDEIRELNGLENDEYALLVSDPDVEILAHTENAAAGPDGGVTSDAAAAGAPAPAAVPPSPAGAAPQGEPSALQAPQGLPPASAGDPTHDVRYRVKSGKCCVFNVAPENFLMARDATDIKTTPYCGDRQLKSLSDLIAMGYDKDQVQTLPTDDDATLDDEQQERKQGDDDSGDAPDRTGVMRQVWFSEHYILIDYDGDGIAERRKVCTAGAAHTVLKYSAKDGKPGGPANEPWEGQPPYFSVTPKPKSHRFFGRSIADVTMDMQRISSALTRQLLDNAYLSNNPRNVVSDKVNLDDLMSVRLGAFIRLTEGAMPGEGHVQPQVTPFVAGEVIPILQHFDTVKENRTGVTKYNQGSDADSLNKTARGITQIMSAAAQRVDLIARIFAETGVSEMFTLILQCVSKYQKKARVIKVAGSWTPIDPRGWESMFKMQINVGLGTGNKDQQLMHLQTIAEMQKEIMLGGNPGGLVSPENIFNAMRKIVENAGLKDPELYFTDPSKNQQPQQPKPDPAMADVQRKAEKDKADIALKQQDQTATQALKAKEIQGNQQLEAAKLVVGHGLQAHEAHASRGLQAQGAEADRAQQAQGAEADRSLQREQGQQDRQAQTMDASQAVDKMGKMLADFMATQQARDAKQDATIQQLASQLSAGSSPVMGAGA